MILIRERIGKLLEYIGALVYPEKYPVCGYEILRSGKSPADIRTADSRQWETFREGQLWGGHREYFLFRTTVEIPADFDGKCVVYELKTGREGEWDATNPQFRFYLNGKLIQGLDVNHREVLISEHAQKGQQYGIMLRAYTGDRNFSLQLDSCLKICDRKTEKYYYDLRVPYETAGLLQPDDTAYITIIQALNESLNLLDLRQEGSAAYYESLEKAQDCLTKNFYETKCGGPADAAVYCVGHTHIDCAWPDACGDQGQGGAQFFYGSGTDETVSGICLHVEPAAAV